MARKPSPVLSPEAAAQWAAATGDARPLKNKPAPAPLPRVRAVVTHNFPHPQDLLGPLRSPGHDPMMATLDATWDRKTRLGTVAPERKLDLHGLTLVRAHHALVQAVHRAAAQHVRVLLVITGKGTPPSESWPEPDPKRGSIRAAFAQWCASAELAPFIASVRPAHARHGGGGAWYVILRRVR